MKNRIKNEIERVLLLGDLRDRLDNLRLDELLALKRWLNLRKEKTRPGAPAVYSDDLLDDVHSRVRSEMLRLKKAGERRAGAKKAIRNVVEQFVVDQYGKAYLANHRIKIDATILYFFKAFEARRKRG
jgi:hypothetical protein